MLNVLGGGRLRAALFCPDHQHQEPEKQKAMSGTPEHRLFHFEPPLRNGLNEGRPTLEHRLRSPTYFY
jgi:hypothetical protein